MRTILLLFLWPSLLLAQNIDHIAGFDTTSEISHRAGLYISKDMAHVAGLEIDAGIHDCSGDQSFGWSFESQTITSGNPAGCTDGTATVNSLNGGELTAGSLIDGTYDYYAESGENVTFTNFDEDEFNPDDFKIEIITTINTWADQGRIFYLRNDTNLDNRLELKVRGASTAIRFLVWYYGATNYEDVELTNSEWDEGDTFIITLRGKTGVAGNDFELKVCELDPATMNESNCDTDTDDDDQTAWDLDTNAFLLGDSAGGLVQTMGRVRIYQTSGF
jgi:hypothetical protein